MSFTLGNIVAIVGGLLLIAIGGVLVRAATLPVDFRISRSIRVAAPPERVYPMIADLRQLNEWNPFARQDPSISITYSEPAEGVGSHFSWTSTGQAGAGSMTITSATPQAVAMDLTFEKPFAARNKVVFGISPNGNGADVSWTMTGSSPFLHRIFSVFMSPDKMVGGAFEKGLADLRARLG
jgi:hypothetical protein